MTEWLNMSENIAGQSFFDWAKQCKEECVVYVKYNALNEYLWILFLAMFIITLYAIVNKNESALQKVSLMTGQPDIKHIQDTIDWLLTIGILFIIVYIVVFLIKINNLAIG